MHFVLSGEEADMAEGKILMVDDDKEIADLVEIHLKGEGYQPPLQTVQNAYFIFLSFYM